MQWCGVSSVTGEEAAEEAADEFGDAMGVVERREAAMVRRMCDSVERVSVVRHAADGH